MYIFVLCIGYAGITPFYWQILLYVCKMNRIFENLKLPLLAILLFFLFQVVTSFSVILLSAVAEGEGLLDSFSSNSINSSTMGIASLLTNILIAVSCFFIFKRNRYKGKTSSSRPASLLQNMLAFAACVLGAVALDFLSELMSIPNIVEDQMIDMCRTPWGIIAIAVGAPLGEEIMFRWGIMGHMLRRNSGVVLSIVASSLLFGVAHLNPAQVFFATAMGVMLGILYWRSGSLFLPLVLHALNNSIACLQVWILGDKIKEFSLVETVGGNGIAWCMVVACSILCVSVLGWYVKENVKD